MEVSITKMSQNGQVVIPAEIRRESNIKPQTKFLIFNENGNILLKRINEKMLREEMDLITRIEESETAIREGRTVKADSKMSLEEIDDLLLGE